MGMWGWNGRDSKMEQELYVKYIHVYGQISTVRVSREGELYVKYVCVHVCTCVHVRDLMSSSVRSLPVCERCFKSLSMLILKCCWSASFTIPKNSRLQEEKTSPLIFTKIIVNNVSSSLPFPLSLSPFLPSLPLSFPTSLSLPSLSPFLSPYTPVIVVNEPIVEDTVYLMDPESSEFVSLFHVCLWDQQHAPHHTREVSQVEHIV